jgi:hypothetical protein
MNDLTAAVTFLDSRNASITIGGVPVTITVSGPRTLEADGPLPPLCVVQAAGPAGAELLANPEHEVGYLLRFYGPDDLAALHAHEALKAATYANLALAVPVMYWEQAGRLLKWFTISAPTGPVPEPGTDRLVVLATGRARWAR